MCPGEPISCVMFIDCWSKVLRFLGVQFCPLLQDGRPDNCAVTTVLHAMFCRRQRSIEAYRVEVSCVNRLRHEIITLRQLVSSQQKTIAELTATCEQLRCDKYKTGEYHILQAVFEICMVIGIFIVNLPEICENGTL
jgi:hypothetical protein